MAEYQNSTQQSNKIQILIQKVISPHRFLHDADRFERARVEINKRISFVGIELQPTGKYRRVAQASTISEAHNRADILKHKLQERFIQKF